MTPKMDDTTQMRIIRAEAREAVADECNSILATVRTVGMEIKQEMRTHFATKEELAAWKLDMYKNTEERLKICIDDHKKRDVSSTKIPMPTMVTNKDFAKLAGAITFLGGGVWALIEFLPRLFKG